MSRFHIDVNGEPAKCNAKSEESCPRAKEGSPHGDSLENVQVKHEQLNQDRTIKNLKKNKVHDSANKDRESRDSMVSLWNNKMLPLRQYHNANSSKVYETLMNELKNNPNAEDDMKVSTNELEALTNRLVDHVRYSGRDYRSRSEVKKHLVATRDKIAEQDMELSPLSQKILKQNKHLDRFAYDTFPEIKEMQRTLNIMRKNDGVPERNTGLTKKQYMDAIQSLRDGDASQGRTGAEPTPRTAVLKLANFVNETSPQTGTVRDYEKFYNSDVVRDKIRHAGYKPKDKVMSRVIALAEPGENDQVDEILENKDVQELQQHFAKNKRREFIMHSTPSLDRILIRKIGHEHGIENGARFLLSLQKPYSHNKRPSFSEVFKKIEQEKRDHLEW